jgi:hypothetical protein
VISACLVCLTGCSCCRCVGESLQDRLGRDSAGRSTPTCGCSAWRWTGSAGELVLVKASREARLDEVAAALA